MIISGSYRWWSWIIIWQGVAHIYRWLCICMCIYIYMYILTERSSWGSDFWPKNSQEILVFKVFCGKNRLARTPQWGGARSFCLGCRSGSPRFSPGENWSRNLWRFTSGIQYPVRLFRVTQMVCNPPALAVKNAKMWWFTNANKGIGWWTSD